MSFTRKVGVLFVLYFGSLCSGMVPSSSSVQPHLLRAELAPAREKWNAVGYVSYWMHIRVTCNCLSNGQTMVLYVNDDKALPFVSGDVETVNIRTVEGFYSWIEELADNSGGAEVDVKYDSTAGYPTSISLDFSSESSGGKFVLTITLLALRDKIGYVSSNVPIPSNGFNSTQHSLNQKKWTSVSRTGSKFTFTRDCSCVDEYSSAFFVRTKKGEVVVARYIREGDTTVPDAVRGTLFTITDLFNVVEDIARYANEADIEYDATEGYITNAMIKVSYQNEEHKITMKTALQAEAED